MKTDFFRPSAADFDALTELWENSVRATHLFLDKAYIDRLRPLVRNAYLGEVDLYGIRADEGRILAFMGVSGRKIEMLFVDPAFRGTGLGGELVQYAIRKLRVNSVDVNEQNGQAVGFYLHLGFAEQDRSATDGLDMPYPILHLKLKDHSRK